MSSSIVREPLNFGGFFKLLVTFYKHFFVRGICYGLLATAPSIIFTIIVGSVSQKDMTWGQFLFYANIFSIGVLLANFGYIALCTACSQHYLGERVNWKLANAAGKKNVWRFLGTSLLIGILFGLGLICLVIPGILVVMNYAVALPVVALENKTVQDSLNRSKELTYGHRKRISGYLSVYGLFSILIGMFVVSVIAFFIDSENFGITYKFVFYGFEVITFALMPLYTTLLYFDLCARKEANTPQNLKVVEDEAGTVLR